MNIRVIATIIALSAPIAILYVVTQYAGNPAESTPARNDGRDIPPPHRERPPARPESDSASRPPVSRAGEIEFLRKRLADLEKMNDDEWEENRKQRAHAGRPPHPPRWDSERPEINRTPVDPNEGRVPEISPTPASPLIEHFPKTPPSN